VELSVILVVAWGLGTLAAYGMTFRLRLISWRLHQDERSFRDLLTFGALMLSSAATALAFVVVALSIDGSDLRRLLFGVGWGAFSMAGVLALTATPSEDPEKSRRDLHLFVVGGAVAGIVIAALYLVGVVR
jgi:hypothetical protein